jgi:hypothetical protein
MKKKFINNKIVSCLCGSIKFKANDILRHVINCHCKQCMKTHGHYSAYTSVNEKKISFISKKNLKWYQSSKKAKRGFCNKCGASIFFKRIDNQNISIAAGMFQNPTELETKENIFTKGKLDYYKLDKKLPKFDKYFK